MNSGSDQAACSRIVMIAGSPGTGKTTISRILAEKSSYDRAVHIEVDDFWQCIRKGYVHPWLEGSGDQNETVAESVAASALRFSKGGYEVFIAGTIGPWFLKPWIKMANNGVDVRYIVLRPDEDTTVKRATERQQRDFFPLNAEVIKEVWRSFTGLEQYESHVLDTTDQTLDDSVAAIQQNLFEGSYRIP